jgi:hypothetical protein
VAGSAQPLPRAFDKLDIPPLRGLSGCAYSSRRLFFGSLGRLVADLESVWHADSTGSVLRVVFSSPQLTVVRWRSDEAEDAVALASFAERIKAQRDRRLADLSSQSRQQAADQLAELRNNGLLAAALAEIGKANATPQPKTLVGQWLLACMLDRRDLRDQLGKSLNGGQGGWNNDEPAVIEAVSQIASRKLFPDGDDVAEVSAFVTRMRELVRAHTPDAKLPGHEETEAVIRAALGDRNIVLSRFRNQDPFEARIAVISGARSKLALADETITQMIADGEDFASDRGWHPPVGGSGATVG